MSTTKQLDQLIAHFTEGGLPGCALQVSQKGKTLYEGYSGFADIAGKKPVAANSIFRMASMSKIPLYVTMMILFERGKFLLTDPVSSFFPEWKDMKKFRRQPNGYMKVVPAERPITVRDTLSMKCGLPYCNFPMETADATQAAMQECMAPLWEKGHFTLREQIAAVAAAPLAFEPGTRWLYGFSSELAAGIIEAVCQKPVNEVFKELLFEPLGMENTGAIFFGDIPQRMVTLYKKDADGKLSPLVTDLDKKHLPGAKNETGWARLFSNVNDFSKLMQMLANGGVAGKNRFLSEKTIDMMRDNGLSPTQQADFDADAYNAGYGYGYGVRTLIDKEKGNHNGSLGAFGWTGGFGTWCEADPEDGVSIVYMHNMMPNEERYYHLRVRTAAYGCVE